MFLSSATVLRGRSLLLLGLAAPLLLSGCLPSTGIEGQLHPDKSGPAAEAQTLSTAPQEPSFSPEEQAAYEKQVIEPALATINGRITSYGQKLADWQKIGNSQDTLRLSSNEIEQIITCRNTVADLQEAYKGLQEKLLQEKSMEASRALLFKSLQEFKGKDIAYLEGACPQLFEKLSTPSSQNITPNTQQEETASQLPAAYDTSKTVSNNAGQDDSGSRYKHGLALLQAGQKEEAKRLLSNLLAEVRQQENQQMEIKILAMLADLDFALRDFSAARVKYEELRRIDSSSDRYSRQLAALATSVTRRDELEAYADLLLGCLSYNPERDGFTIVQQATEFIRLHQDSLLLKDAERLSQQVGKKAEQWFEDLLDEADRLQEQGKQKEALERLEQVPLDILPLDKQDTIRQKKAELTSATETAQSFAPDHVAQNASPAPLPEPGDALQELWDKGILLLQQGKYDESVSLFSKLSGTSFAVKAESKIEEAEQLAAEDLRKKAAELFQQADTTADPSAKKALLRSSKALLEDILRKYPRSRMEDKVRRNLNSVDKELAGTGKG